MSLSVIRSCCGEIPYSSIDKNNPQSIHLILLTGGRRNILLNKSIKSLERMACNSAHSDQKSLFLKALDFMDPS